MIPAILSAVVPLIDKIIPDKEAAAKAKMELMAQQNSYEVQMVEKQLSAIVAEANSSDPWTSRARPMFLYVVYILLLAAIPMGILSAFNPDTAVAITDGFKAWLIAIPEPIITLFGVGYLGYAGARTIDKWKGGTK